MMEGVGAAAAASFGCSGLACVAPLWILLGIVLSGDLESDSGKEGDCSSAGFSCLAWNSVSSPFVGCHPCMYTRTQSRQPQDALSRVSHQAH